jgi:hypothetical protein
MDPETFFEMIRTGKPPKASEELRPHLRAILDNAGGPNRTKPPLEF